MTVQIFKEKAKAVIRSRPELAERNLRTLTDNAMRAGLPTVHAYAQDVRDILKALDEARAEALSSVELNDPASSASMKAAVGGRPRA